MTRNIPVILTISWMAMIHSMGSTNPASSASGQTPLAVEYSAILEESPDPVRRWNAYLFLAEIVRDPEVFLRSRLMDSQEDIQVDALMRLGYLKDRESIPDILTLARSGRDGAGPVAREILLREFGMPEGLLESVVSSGEELPVEVRTNLEDWQTAEVPQDATRMGVLRVEVIDSITETPISARIDLISMDESYRVVPRRFFTSPTGQASIRLEAGDYDAYASKGPEWSLDRMRLRIRGNSTSGVTFALERVMETPGHFGVALRARRDAPAESMRAVLGRLAAGGFRAVISGEPGVVMDLPPIVRAMGLEKELIGVPGVALENDYLGFFSVFPIEPDDQKAGFGAPAVASATSEVFFSRVSQTAEGRILQVNRGRTTPGGYLNVIELSPGSGLVDRPEYSIDFQAMEVLSSETGARPGQLMLDWYHLLNHGHRITGVAGPPAFGRSPGGVLRNFVAVEADESGVVTSARLADSVRKGRLVLSNGPFVQIRGAGGSGPGDLVSSSEAVLDIEIRSAPYIHIHRAETVLNGRVVERWDIAPGEQPVRFSGTRRYRLSRDSWILIMVHGEYREPGPWGRDTRAIALTNPIFFDADGDRTFTGPYRELEQDFVSRLLDPGFPIWVRSLPAEDRVFLVETVARKQVRQAFSFVQDMLSSLDPEVRLAAVRASRDIDPEMVRDDLWRIYGRPLSRAEQEAALGVLISVDRKPAMAELLASLGSGDADHRTGAIRILGEAADHTYLRNWHLIGPFPNPGACCLDAIYPPEGNIDLEGVYAGKNRQALRWRPYRARGTPAWVNFAEVYGESPWSMGYAYSIYEASRSGTYHLLVGSDDGVVLWINGREILRSDLQRAASPGQEYAEIGLKEGPNEILVKLSQHVSEWRACVQIVDPYEEE